MFYTGAEEDDAEFNITSTGGNGSKLASLFSLEQPSKEQSLTYTAPKQPKKPEGAPSGAQASILYVVAVHAYKLVDQQYANQGKLGAAILGSHEALSYKLLLYKGQQQHVAVATIGLGFVYNPQNNKYASFYDDRKENWSILFDSDQNSIDFAKQIALAKANSTGQNLNSVVVQDLTPGDSGALEIGDSAEIKYTGWLLTNYTVGKEFDSNANSDRLMRIKLGKGKVIKGWEEGLIGAKKNMHRLLVIPPSLGYGSQPISDKVPANSTLIFEVFVNKIKASTKDSRPVTPLTGLVSAPRNSVTMETTVDTKMPEPTDSPRHSIHSNPGDDSVKARGASLSEQFTQSPKSEKAKIISRMAKMGMPMLPMQGAVAAQLSSESENEDELQKRRSLTASPAREPSPKPIVRPRPIVPNPHGVTEASTGIHSSSVHHSSLHSHQMALYQPQYPGYSYPMASGQPMAVFPQVSATISHQPSIGDTHLPVLISETRTQNSEVRMALGKITDKVEAVLTKLEQSKSQTPNSSGGSGPYMDASSLQQNIDRIVQENIKWKADLDVKNAKITCLNEKICELLERNQKLVEESNLLMEKRSDTFQSSTAQSHTRLINLEQEKVRLTSDLAQALSQIADLKLEIQKLQNNAQQNMVSSSLNTSHFEDSLSQLKSQISEKTSLTLELESQLSNSKDQIRLLNTKVEQLEDQISTLKTSYSSMKNDTKKAVQEVEKEKEKIEKELQTLKHTHKNEIKDFQMRLTEVSAKPEVKESRTLDDNVSIELMQYKEKINILENQRDQLQQRILQMEAIQDVSKTPQLESKLKKAMTGLYRLLQKEISMESEYQGQDILQVVLRNIRVVTVAMLETESEEKQETKVENSQSTSSSKFDVPHASASVVVENAPKEINADTAKENNTPHLVIKEAETLCQAPTSVEVPSALELTNEVEEEREEIKSCEMETEKDETDKAESLSEESTTKTELNKATDEEPRISNATNSTVKDSKLTVTTAVTKPVEPFLKTHPKDEQEYLYLEDDDPKKKYLFFDTKTKTWKPQPPPPPLFDDDDEDDDDWLK